jgi:hypothetical protein
VLPTTEIGTGPGVLSDHAAALEDLGFDHVHLWDHVVGFGWTGRPDWAGTWDSTHAFRERLTTLARLAARTWRIEFVIAVLDLPQRQMLVLAKAGRRDRSVEQGQAPTNRNRVAAPSPAADAHAEPAVCPHGHRSRRGLAQAFQHGAEPAQDPAHAWLSR